MHLKKKKNVLPFTQVLTLETPYINANTSSNNNVLCNNLLLKAVCD